MLELQSNKVCAEEDLRVQSKFSWFAHWFQYERLIGFATTLADLCQSVSQLIGLVFQSSRADQKSGSAMDVMLSFQLLSH